MTARENFPPLYVLLDPAVASIPIEELTEAVLSGGATLLQYRDKHATARKTFDVAVRLSDKVRSAGARLIVNDRPDVAAMCSADGAHLGQEDVGVEPARKLCPHPQWIGVSTHNLDQLQEASKTSADYIAFGPIFPTRSKATPDPVVGLGSLREARRATLKPLVAIGGITTANAADVFAAGADCVAVTRDIIGEPRPDERVREYLDIAVNQRKIIRP